MTATGKFGRKTNLHDAASQVAADAKLSSVNKRIVLATAVVVVAAAVAIPIALTGSASAATRKFTTEVVAVSAPSAGWIGVGWNVKNVGTEAAKPDCHVTIAGFHSTRSQGEVDGHMSTEPPGADLGAFAQFQGPGEASVKRSQVSVTCT